MDVTAESAGIQSVGRRARPRVWHLMVLLFVATTATAFGQAELVRFNVVTEEVVDDSSVQLAPDIVMAPRAQSMLQRAMA